MFNSLLCVVYVYIAISRYSLAPMWNGGETNVDSEKINVLNRGIIHT